MTKNEKAHQISEVMQLNHPQFAAGKGISH